MGLAAAQLLRYLVVLRLATGVYHAMRDPVTELTWTSNAFQEGDTVLELNCSGLGQAAEYVAYRCMTQSTVQLRKYIYAPIHAETMP